MTILEIQQTVANHFEITVEELLSKTRKQPVVFYRYMAMLLCRNYTKNSLQKIGKAFGNRDHSTVINALDMAEGAINTSKYLKDSFSIIETVIIAGANNSEDSPKAIAIRAIGRLIDQHKIYFSEIRKYL